LILSEIGISQETLNEFVESLFIWYNSLDPSSIVVVGALPTGRPSNATDLRYSVVASDSITQQYIENKDVRVLPQGVVYGSVALSLMEAKRYGISSFGILSHCIATIPDYLAAKKVVEIFQILLEDDIPIEPLQRNAIELKEHLIRREKSKKKKGESSDFDEEDDVFFQNLDDSDQFYDEDEDEDFSKFI
jgi:predicted ATP-grasp superfamily ATP-dependent carboligase